MERNCLVHRVGIGRLDYSRRYQDADLEIVLRLSTKFNVPYYRLYAVVNGKSSFLIDRGEKYNSWRSSFHSTQVGGACHTTFSGAEAILDELSATLPLQD